MSAATPQSWVTLEWTSAREFGMPAEGPGERILATVLFTDIVSWTTKASSRVPS
jgi:hypothetical protein